MLADRTAVQSLNFGRTPVVRPACDMRGYSRCTSYVRRPCAGRKFRRKSTTPTEMSHDLHDRYAYIWKTFLFLPFSSFLVRYTEVTSFCTSPQHIHRVTMTYNFVPYTCICQLVFTAILWVKLGKMLDIAVSLK